MFCKVFLEMLALFGIIILGGSILISVLFIVLFVYALFNSYITMREKKKK